jgi:hypothetical protein
MVILPLFSIEQYRKVAPINLHPIVSATILYINYEVRLTLTFARLLRAL